MTDVAMAEKTRAQAADSAPHGVEGMEAGTASRISCTASTSSQRRRGVTLLGRNGAGKTTTLKSIMGLCRAAPARCALPPGIDRPHLGHIARAALPSAL